MFDFGAPGFWELVQTIRLSVLDAALEQGLPLLVMTFVYVHPSDLPTFEQFEATVERRRGTLLAVHLACPTGEIVRRVGTPDRAARRKMTSETAVRQFLDQHDVSPVPRPNCLMLDSEVNSAETNALAIIRHFALV